MIQSITFHDNNLSSSKNTYTDWNLIASVCPVFAPPKQKTLYIDIPGSNGALDLSEALTGFPVYENRTGELDFSVLNDYGPWSGRYSELMAYLHGRTLQAVLFDDPEWFYRGRFSIGSWTPGNPFASVRIGYNVEPYKWNILNSVEDWLWDSFNFETGIIRQQTFENIEINSIEWVEFTWDAVLFGDAPIHPILEVSDSEELDIEFQGKVIRLQNESNELFDFIFYGQTEYIVKFKGIGKIKFIFRVGRL